MFGSIGRIRSHRAHLEVFARPRLPELLWRSAGEVLAVRSRAAPASRPGSARYHDRRATATASARTRPRPKAAAPWSRCGGRRRRARGVRAARGSTLQLAASRILRCGGGGVRAEAPAGGAVVVIGCEIASNGGVGVALENCVRKAALETVGLAAGIAGAMRRDDVLLPAS